MSRTRFRHAGLLLAALFGLPHWAEALPRLTVRDAIELALRRNPASRIVSALTDSAKARVGQAESGYLPRVFFGAQWLGGTINGNATSFINFPDFPRIAGSSPNRNASVVALWSNYMTGFSTAVPIYDFGRTRGRVNEALSGVKEGEATERTVRERIIFAVRRAYYSVLVSRGAVRAAEEAVERLAKYAAQAQEGVKQGLRRPIEVPRTQAELARARVRVVAAQNEVKIAWVQLSNALGEQVEGRFELFNDANVNDRVDAPVESCLVKAYNARPELAEQRHRIQAMHGRVESTQGNYYPTLSASAAVNLRGTGGVGNYVNFDGAVLLSWPLFEGNLFKKQEEEARARLRSLDAATEEIRQRIEFEVRTAHAQVKSAEQFIRAAQAAFSHAKDNHRLATESFTRGLTSVVELADAEELFLVSELNVIRSTFDVRLSLTNLERAVGEPVPVAR